MPFLLFNASAKSLNVVISGIRHDGRGACSGVASKALDEQSKWGQQPERVSDLEEANEPPNAPKVGQRVYG